MFRTVLSVLLLFVPWPVRRALLNRFFGYKIHRTARIGLSIVIPDQLEMEAGARIKHLTICRELRCLKLGANSVIGNLNWISGVRPAPKGPFSYKADRDPSLYVGKHSALTMRHTLDCTDRIAIGNFSIVAGFGSLLMTHSINLEGNRQECTPVEIGDYCFVGARSVLLPGSRLPSYSVLSAASLLNKAYSEEYVLYGGVPTKPLKKLDHDWKYFNRTEGFVG